MTNKSHRSFICGIKGKHLTQKEISFLKKYKPWGIILFSRNINSINQTQELINSIKKNHFEINTKSAVLLEIDGDVDFIDIQSKNKVSGPIFLKVKV